MENIYEKDDVKSFVRKWDSSTVEFLNRYVCVSPHENIETLDVYVWPQLSNSFRHQPITATNV
jgi:hypothetical protein